MTIDMPEDAYGLARSSFLRTAVLAVNDCGFHYE